MSTGAGAAAFRARLGALLDTYESAHPVSRRFYERLISLAELHHAKQQDYGRDGDPLANVRAAAEWGIPPWLGACLRLNDKVKRLQSLARKGTLRNEPADDSLRDIAVYALIALELLPTSPAPSEEP